MDADAGANQADPRLGVLGALDSLPSEWRTCSQLVVFEPAPTNTARAYQRLALENPVAAERSSARSGGASHSGFLSLLALGLSAIVGLNAWSAWQAGEWVTVAAIIGGLLASIGLGVAGVLPTATARTARPPPGTRQAQSRRVSRGTSASGNRSRSR